MPVLNKYKDPIPKDAIYIGRGSIWGNPFPMTHKSMRDEVISKHKLWLMDQIKHGKYTLQQLASLHNKNLVCYCAPKPCHGDDLLKAA